MNLRFGIDSAIFLAGFTASLYAWSTASYQGFLSVLHLNPDMMERNFHQVIYSGLLIAFAPALIMLIIATATLYFYSHAILPSYIDWVRKSISSKRKAIKLRRFWYGKRNSPPIEVQAKSLFTKFFLITIFGISFALSLAYFEKLGSKKAEKLIKLHQEGMNNVGSLVLASVGDQTKKLLFLACGSANCAGIEIGTDEVFYFPNSSGYSFQYIEGEGASELTNKNEGG